eukprot:3695170-Pleurochrysis_carterae.AAC.2
MPKGVATSRNAAAVSAWVIPSVLASRIRLSAEESRPARRSPKRRQLRQLGLWEVLNTEWSALPCNRPRAPRAVCHAPFDVRRKSAVVSSNPLWICRGKRQICIYRTRLIKSAVAIPCARTRDPFSSRSTQEKRRALSCLSLPRTRTIASRFCLQRPLRDSLLCAFASILLLVMCPVYGDDESD